METTRICVEIPKPLVKRMRQAALDEETTIRAWVEQAIEEKLGGKKA